MIGKGDRWLHTANYMNMNEHRLGILDGRGYRVMLEMAKTSGRIRLYQIRNREWGREWTASPVATSISVIRREHLKRP